jgi:hypothetical protein
VLALQTPHLLKDEGKPKMTYPTDPSVRDALPDLPEPAMEDVPYELWGQNMIHPALYTAEQMRDYARDALSKQEAATPAIPSDVPRLHDFIRREVERAIDEAVNPKGMSVHDGKARIGSDKLAYMLKLIDNLYARAALKAAQPVPLEPAPMTREWCAAYPGAAAGIINSLARQVDAMRPVATGYAEGKVHMAPQEPAEPVALHPGELPDKRGLWLDEHGRYYRLTYLPPEPLGHETERCGSEPATAATPSPSVEHFRRIGWTMSEDDPYYTRMVDNQTKEAMEQGERYALSQRFDTPVFVAIYTQDELDAADKRAREFAKGIIVE